MEQILYKNIPKKVRNGIKARIESAVQKYGFKVFRKCVFTYIDSVNKKNKLQQEIDAREKELTELKKQK